ncbi:MAG: YfhO family protein [Acidobacteriia bacterium]|nr:YfhO family protein [Terriglobia bacterium]
MSSLLGRLMDSWRAAAVTVALVPLIPHLPLLLGRVSPVWDALNGFGPYFMLIGDYVRHGEFLLWNPFINGGSPDYIEPQLGAFSPLVMLMAFVSGGSRLGFGLYWLAVWVLGPVGVLILARRLGAPAWGGVVAALGFAFSGLYTGQAEHTPHFATISFLPLVLWRLDVAMRAGSYRAAAEAGALWGLSALAGYPGLVLLNWCFAFLWSVGRVLWEDTTPRMSFSSSLRRLIVMHGVVLLIGLVVLSPTYGAFFVEGPGYSQRTDTLPREVVIGQIALHPATLLTLASPAFAFVDMFEYTDIAMRSVYLGTLVPILAAVAVIGRRRGLRWWLLALAIGFLLTAMGRALPFRGWLYDWFPPTRYFRAPALFRNYFILGVSLLSVFGARDLAATLQTQSRREWRRFVAIAACSVLAALTVFAVTLGLVGVNGEAVRTIARAHAWATWLAPAALVAVASVAGWQRRADIMPLALVGLAVVDALGTAVIVRPLMYGQSAAWRAVAGEHRPLAALSQAGLMRLPDNGGNFTFVSKTPAMHGYSPLAGVLFDDYAEDPVLLASATGERRIWFSAAVTRLGRSLGCFEAFEARAAQLGAPPLVIHSPEVMRQSYKFPYRPPNQPRAATRASVPCDATLDAAPAAERLDSRTVRVVAYEPRRLTLQVDVPTSGWLLVTDSWSYGWNASVNGRATPLSGGNFIFRAVPVDAGTNVVDFQFDAFGFPWLVCLSWLTLAAVGAAAIIRPTE